MTQSFLPFEHVARLHAVEQDWLFEKFLIKLNSHRHLLLTADPHWGVQEYVKELGFQLEEKHRDIQICSVDVRLAQSSAEFLHLFHTTLCNKFEELKLMEEVKPGSVASLRLPSVIARKERTRLAVFLSNSHLFHRFGDADFFLRTLRRSFKSQKSCIFCLHGNDTLHFRKLVRAPGPLSGLGQLFELRHNPTVHRSASIRKLFHDNDKKINYRTSIQISYAVDNHPYYLKLLAWHALIRTRNLCTLKIVDEAMSDLLLHFEDHFQKIVERLTPKQLSFLKALLEQGSRLCSESVLKDYQLGSSGNVARIKLSLKNKEIINTVGRDIVFTDPLFRKWLQVRYFKTLTISPI